ncbi:hypothetical protein VNN36_07775 [Lactococcus garvieae]|uniref:hypothetical protein n=1 Tax=Lactococcus garvieae TaxID=1363 RepID=UPI0030CBA8BF
MNKTIREQMLKEADRCITLSTFQLIEGENFLYGIGWKTTEKVGSWVSYDKQGHLIHPWKKLTSQTLLHIIYEHVQARGFLKEGTFSFGNWHFRERHSLSCWGVGRDGLLYRSLWSLTGVCVLEWSAHLPTKVNQERIKKDWMVYKKYQRQNGCW